MKHALLIAILALVSPQLVYAYHYTIEINPPEGEVHQRLAGAALLNLEERVPKWFYAAYPPLEHSFSFTATCVGPWQGVAPIGTCLVQWRLRAHKLTPNGERFINAQPLLVSDSRFIATAPPTGDPAQVLQTIHGDVAKIVGQAFDSLIHQASPADNHALDERNS